MQIAALISLHGCLTKQEISSLSCRNKLFLCMLKIKGIPIPQKNHNRRNKRNVMCRRALDFGSHFRQWGRVKETACATGQGWSISLRAFSVCLYSQMTYCVFTALGCCKKRKTLHINTSVYSAVTEFTTAKLRHNFQMQSSTWHKKK